MIAPIVRIRDTPIETLEPTGSSKADIRTGGYKRPQRPHRLDGKVLAVIDSDSPGESESYFTLALIAKMRQLFDLADVIWVRKANRTHAPQPDLWQKVLERADVGVAMYGGCGTCSSRTMRDAIEMELAGIPAVAIAHEELRGAIESMRKISKALDTPYVLVTRPVTPNGDWGEAATDEVVERIVPLVLAELTVDSSAVRQSA
jgi:hypothetical protein